MRTFIQRGLLLLMFLQVALVSCVKDGTDITPTGGPSLSLKYSIVGADQTDLTRAEPGTALENKIDGLYTFFFQPSASGTGLYLGYSYSGITAAPGGATGSSRVTIPAGCNVQDAFSLIIVANLDGYVDLGGHANIDAYLTALLTAGTHDQNYARANLLANVSTQSGIGSPLLMSVEFNKPAGTNIAAVDLTRVVSRVDVVDTTPSTKFQLVNAQVWNARNIAYVTDHSGNTPASGLYTNYKGNVQTTALDHIKTGLYFFENTITTPTQNDHQTTCLIIGGYYNGNTAQVKYYRVNICAKHSSQYILRNHLYTIKINDVLADGHTDPGDAYDDTQLKIDYTINDWDEGFNGNYVFDKDGNGLAVSQRMATFSNAGSQAIEIEVMRIFSKTNPISTDWSVDSPLTGADASKFKGVKKPLDPQNKWVVVEPLGNNISAGNYTATATVRWGGLSIPITLTQLSPNATPVGLKATPANLWFSKDATGNADAKEFTLDVLGNHVGVNPLTDINVATIWGTGNTGWFSVQFVSDEGGGVYKYKIVPTKLTDPSMAYRDANVRLTLIANGVSLSATVYVKQSALDENYETTVRSMLIELHRLKSGSTTVYANKGSLSTAYSLFKGMPTGTSSGRDLHFALNDKTEIKYNLKITSIMDWQIVPHGAAASRLNFTQTSGTGSNGVEVQHSIWITANKDIVNDSADPSAGRWDASFDIVFENGDIETFACHQTGVLSKHWISLHPTYADESIFTQYHDTYYYGTIFMNGRYWLDRNIGATISDLDQTAPYSNIHNVTVGSTDAIHPPGLALLQNITAPSYMATVGYDKVCPKGFRLPKASSANGDEWDWWMAAAKMGIMPDGTAAPVGSPYQFMQSIEYSTSPYKRLYLPAKAFATYTANSRQWEAGAAYGYWAYPNGTTSVYIAFNVCPKVTVYGTGTGGSSLGHGPVANPYSPGFSCAISATDQTTWNGGVYLDGRILFRDYMSAGNTNIVFMSATNIAKPIRCIKDDN